MKRLIWVIALTICIINAGCQKEPAKIAVEAVTLNPISISLTVGESAEISATVSPDNATNNSVIWSSDKEAVATVTEEGVVSALKSGTATITVTTVDQGKTATCEVKVTPAIPEAVDLGLSVKWAAWNLGATKPEEYGGYYQWAGTEDVSDTSIYLDLTNCPYHTGTDDKTGWTKYVSASYPSYWSGAGKPDSIKFLNSEDDAATVNLGGKWRMPRQSEVEELTDKCTTEWTTMNGVKGRTFTSTINGNSIFLPAAGFRDGDHLGGEGSYGHYWSSSRVMEYPDRAQNILIKSEKKRIEYIARYLGLSVRAVTD